MPVNILPQPGTPPPPPLKKKKKASALAVLMVIVLTIVLIILGELFLRDVNRWFNPAYSQYGGCYYATSSYKTISSNTLPQKYYDQGDYETFRVLLHGAVVVPIILAAFLLYFILFYKKENSPHKVITWPYFLFAIWMTLHLIIETLVFLVSQYEALGLYIVLIILAAVLTWLVIFIQKKIHQKQQPAG